MKLMQDPLTLHAASVFRYAWQNCNAASTQFANTLILLWFVEGGKRGAIATASFRFLPLSRVERCGRYSKHSVTTHHTNSAKKNTAFWLLGIASCSLSFLQLGIFWVVVQVRLSIATKTAVKDCKNTEGEQSKCLCSQRSSLRTTFEPRMSYKKKEKWRGLAMSESKENR